MQHSSLIALLILQTAITCHLFAGMPVGIMSYNIRRLGEDPVNHQWDKRKNLVFNTALKKKPAVIGFQEVVVGQQLNDLKQGFSNYEVVGDKGRKGYYKGWFQKKIINLDKVKDECNPIFYDPKQVTLISSETFGINPVGKFFRASLPRICTRATFKDRKNNVEFTVYNTHLSSSGAWGLKDGTEQIRTRQIKLILKNIKKQKYTMPIIIMGDFNTKFEGAFKKRLTSAKFVHAKDIALTTKGPKETRTGWNNEQLKIIDHIFTQGKVNVLHYEVIQSPEGEFPSDHRPVYAKIILS